MRYFYNKACWLIIFLAVAGLVAGGLGWVTVSALDLEREQFQTRADKERASKLHLALWRLDSRISPILAREDSRPYSHYSAVYAPSIVLRPDGRAWEYGQVLMPSPLIHTELPPYLLLHFQTDEQSGWQSPQVMDGALRRRLEDPSSRTVLTNVTEERRSLRDELEKFFPPQVMLAKARQYAAAPAVHETTLVPSRPSWGNLNLDEFQQIPFPPTQAGMSGGQTLGQSEFLNRMVQQSRVQREVNATQVQEAGDIGLNNTVANGANWLSNNFRIPVPGQAVDIHLSPLLPWWLCSDHGQPRLLLTRLVRIEKRERTWVHLLGLNGLVPPEGQPGTSWAAGLAEALTEAQRVVCQGIVLDWSRLQEVLAKEIQDLFPQGRLEAILPGCSSDRERTMSTLPVQLLTGLDPEPSPVPGWTPLRVGLGLTWTAGLVALAAVGLGGWSLLNLSERRIRFVSAVTHELRTPLTTLRLYLDMLTGGLVKEETRKEEYLHTLNEEADRLNRLVGNVLDFSRLENSRPRVQKQATSVEELIEGLCSAWQDRCRNAGKELVVENQAAPNTLLSTDAGMVQQVLANLLDNACKYSKGAADPRVWLRARTEGQRLMVEVEDQGPGVPVRERRSIFRPFRRGRGSEVTAGGVGLGLALAQRWTGLLGGRLTLRSTVDGQGACFRLELPVERNRDG